MMVPTPMLGTLEVWEIVSTGLLILAHMGAYFRISSVDGPPVAAHLAGRGAR
jgi:hypothetical protein